MDFLKETLLRKEELINDTQNLLRINSIYDEKTVSQNAPFGKGVKESLDFMLALAKKDGFETFNCDNYSCHIEYGEGEEIIGVLCHLDVVPVSGEWIYPPFSATRTSDRIYARGAIDDKGPLMASYYALKILKENNVKLNRRVRLILGCDEETGVAGINRYFAAAEMPTLGFSPDADFPVIHGEKGMQGFVLKGKTKKSPLLSLKAGERFNIVPDIATMTLDIDLKKEFMAYLKNNSYEGDVLGNVYTIKGKSAHAMQPHKGINAVTLLVDFLIKHIDDELVNYLDKYITHSNFGEKYQINDNDELMGNLTMNLGICNYENNEFFLGIDIRYPNERDVDIIKKNVTASLGCFEVQFSPTNHVHYIDPNSDLVKTLMTSYQKYTNDYENKPFTIGGGTYARTLKNGVAFGPLMVGREDVVHQTNEYILIDDLLTSTAIYCDAIYRLGVKNEN